MIEKPIFSGNHYEMGFQQGKQYGQSIQKGIKALLDSDVIKEAKPKFLPQGLFFNLAKRRAKKLLDKDILEHFPKQADRLRGIADGAAIDLSSILFVQLTELLVGCTAIAVNSKMFSNGEPVLAKNFDYLPFTEAFNLTCESKPKEGYKTIACKHVPLSGTMDGVNEHGLAVTYNLAFSTDKPEVHVPTSLMLQEMLETCKNTQEAVNFIRQAKQGGHDALITLIDPVDDIKTVELSSRHTTVREPTVDYVVNTNHYRTKEMQEITKTPYESSKFRLSRAEELISNKKTLDEKAIEAILSDHGAQELPPSMLTICMHNPRFSTTRSEIFYPKTRKVKILYGHPCKNKYEELTFS
jgi:predicted choloylglycine hydrolase